MLKHKNNINTTKQKKNKQIIMTIIIFSNSNLNFNFSIFNEAHKIWHIGYQYIDVTFVGFGLGFYF